MKVLIFISILVLTLSGCLDHSLVYEDKILCTNNKTFTTTDNDKELRISDGSVIVTSSMYKDMVITSYKIPEGVSCTKGRKLLR